MGKVVPFPVVPDGDGAGKDAVTLKQESQLGSLETGKLADLVVLSAIQL